MVVSKPFPTKPKRPRREAIFVLGFWCVVGGALATICGLLWLQVLSWSGSLTNLALVASGVFATFYVYVASRKALARSFLAANGGFVCPSCHYGLRSLPDVGTCPECGLEYTRTRVVELWEQAYGFGKRYPRSSALSRTIEAKPEAPAARHSLWHTWSLPEAFKQVSIVAIRHGHSGARIQQYAVEFGQRAERARLQPPGELFSLYNWYDAREWSSFVGRRDTVANPQASPEGNTLVEALKREESLQAVRIRPPSLIQSLTIRDLSLADPRVRRVMDAWKARGAGAAWEDSTVVVFADTCDDVPIMICIDPPVLPRASIIAFSDACDECVRLADSLGQWLLRLAWCDGRECLLHPEDLERLSPDVRAMLIEDNRARNPNLQLSEKHLPSSL